MNKVKFAEYWNKLRPFCIMALTIYLIYCVFARKLVVDGYSMEPNFHDGDTLFVNTISMDSRTFGPITKDQIIGKIRETKKYN